MNTTMEIIANLLGLTKLSLLKREQLYAQQRSDDHLSKLADHCPNTVASLLLVIRDQSRRDQHQILNADLTDKYAAVEREIENSRGIYGEIERIYLGEGTASQKCARLNGLRKGLTPANGDQLV
jgi:hypothetical protein